MIFSFFISHCISRGGTVNAAKALELVRTALQPTLNKEIEQVLKSYQEVSFNVIKLYYFVQVLNGTWKFQLLATCISGS